MMHPRAMQPAAQGKIPVRIRNSSKSSLEGTLVSTNETANGSRVVKAVSIIRSVGIVTVSVMMISQGSSEATISCVVARKDVDNAVRTLQLALLGQGLVDKVVAEKDACIIA